MKRIDLIRKYKELSEIAHETGKLIEKTIPFSKSYDLIVDDDEVIIYEKGYEKFEFTIEEAESLLKALKEALYEEVKEVKK